MIDQLKLTYIDDVEKYSFTSIIGIGLEIGEMYERS